MSKAFTREDDDRPERPSVRRAASPLPPGAKNFITPTGERKIRDELDQLNSLKQQGTTTLSGTSAEAIPLADLESRIQQLKLTLASVVVSPPPAEPWDQVRFGATVTTRESDGTETRYRIVGVEEVDLDRDWISWVSPIARALLNARLSERIRFKFPAGERELEIVAITYE